MRRLIAVGVVAVLGSLPIASSPALATSVTIDDIAYQNSTSVNPLVLSATADFSLSGNILTVVLINTSWAATGGAAATNLVTGLAFNLPDGIAIANDGGVNAVAITAGFDGRPASTEVGFTPPILDSTWGVADGAIPSLNNLSRNRGSINAGITTLQTQMDFDLTGTTAGSLGTANFGILSASVARSILGTSLPAVQDSLTFTLLLNGTLPADLIEQIDHSYVIASFGSPNRVPEPMTLLLLGAGLGSALCYRTWSRGRPSRWSRIREG